MVNNVTISSVFQSLISKITTFDPLQYGDLNELMDFRTQYFWIAGIVTVIVIAFPIIYMMLNRTRRDPVDEPESLQTRSSRVRFRKRDKVDFYAKKIMRKGRDTASTISKKFRTFQDNVPQVSRSGRRLHRHERMLILARIMFNRKKQPISLIKKDFPSELLEADNMDEVYTSFPEEVLYLLQSVKVFGHFEKGVFLHLCRHMETLKLGTGESLFNVGDEDKWMYVIQEGHINLYINQDGAEVKLAEFTVGESLHSLLSILDVLTGHTAPYKTVYSRAMKPSTVIRLPVEAFKIAFENREYSLVQMVQVIMTRLQRVTFLALHNYLGLSQELLQPIRKASIMTTVQAMLIKDLAKRHNSLVDFPQDSAVKFADCPTTSNLIRKDSNNVKVKNQTELLRKASTNTAPIISNKDKPIRKISTDKNLRFNPLKTVKDTETNEVSFGTTSKSHSSDNVFRSISSSSKDSTAEKGSDSDSYGNKETEYTVYNLDEPKILDIVTKNICEQLKVDDHELVKKHINLLKVCAGHQLVGEGDQEVSLYLVVTGMLTVFQSAENESVTLYTAKTGMLTGQLAVLTGEPSFFGVAAQIDSVVAQLSRQSFYEIMKVRPQVVLNTAHTVMQTVSPFVRQIDFALDWVKVEAGKSLYKQGSTGDCLYIILHGRMRSVLSKGDGKKELVSEFGRGEIVGINEALSGGPRTCSVHAIRDTELAKMPEGLVKHIRRQHPGVVTRLISLASDKLLGNIMAMRNRNVQRPMDSIMFNNSARKKGLMQDENSMAYGDVSNHLANLSTVAILPASSDVPLAKFSMELNHALTHICPSVLRLNSSKIKERLGPSVFDSQNEYRLSNWLASSEDSHRIVLYQTDTTMTPWTTRCVRQADAVLVVALGDGEPEVGDLESQVESMSVRSLKMLVLLHRPGVKRPSGTVEWLNNRSWLTDHTHVQGPARLFARTKPNRLPEYWEKLTVKVVDRFSDFSRLARFLTGTSVALVLGGGGARGCSQLGIIKAMLEKGIPIDMVGGTSIGSFMGGVWAAHRDLTALRDKMVLLSTDMSSYVPKLFDLTYPVTSMFSGHSFNRAIHQIFEDIQIEDLWIPYFNITTDITSSEMRVHTDGWLWRYVRASMSLSGYLPPICDPKDGHLLMDGGYINNLPGDVARSRGAYKVIAVDVGSENDMDFTNYGDCLSGWWLLWKRFTGRWTGRIKIPDMNDIQSRLSYISSCYLLEKVRTSDYCFYIRPPVTPFKTLDFHRHAELTKLGFEHGEKVFTDEWCDEFWVNLRNNLYKQTTQLNYNIPDGSGRDEASCIDISSYLKDSFTDETAQSDDGYKPEFGHGYESSPEMSALPGGGVQRISSDPQMHQVASDSAFSQAGSQSADENNVTTTSRFGGKKERSMSDSERRIFTTEGLGGSDED